MSFLNHASVYTSHCVPKRVCDERRKSCSLSFLHGEQKPVSYSEVAKLVKKDGCTHPTKQAVYKAVKNFNKKESAKPDRPMGWRKTTKAEDATILKIFKELRPAGHGVDSRIIHTHHPANL